MSIRRPSLLTTYRRLTPTRRRDVWVSFLILFVALASHTVLETARDALFLAELPASTLPIAYFAVAATTALATHLMSGRSPGRALAYTFAVGALGTAAFWSWLGYDRSRLTLIALYVWPGVVTTTLAIQFWLRLHRRLDVEEAKALYGVIAGGASVGALAGAGLATVIADSFAAMALLPVAAIGYGLGALLAFAEGKTPPPPSSAEEDEDHDEQPAWKDGYVLQLVALAGLVAIGTTLVDFLFKSILADRVVASDLASLLGRFHMVVNASAIAAQFLLLPRLLQSFQIRHVLLLLPLAFVSGGVLLSVAASLGTAVLLHGASTVLKHSIHGTTVEMFFLPLRGELRGRAKSWFSSYGTRGGQALTSAAIFVVVRWSWSQLAFAVLVSLLGIVSGVLVLRLHRAYLDRFRDRLRERFEDPRPALPPPLDVSSLKSVVEALSSPNEQEVLAALDLLHLYDEDSLIPPLVLHHRSERVVLRALTLLSRSRQEGVEPLLDALFERPEPEIRAAALRAACAFGADCARRARERLAEDDSLEVAVAYKLASFTAEALQSGRADQTVDDLVGGARPERLALAAGAFLLPERLRGRVVEELIDDGDEQVREALVQALSLFPTEEDLPSLIRLLEPDETRETARRAIMRLSPAQALDALSRHFDDPQTPAAVRRHIPRTVSRFEPKQVSKRLSRWLGREKDDRVMLKLLRGLGRLRDRHPRASIDHRVVRDRLDETVVVARQHLLQRDLVERATRRDPSLDIPASVLLISLLEERVRRATERAFRLLHVLYPRSELSVIHACCFDEDRSVRAASRELLRHLVAREVTLEIVALVEGRGALPSAERKSPWHALQRAFDEDPDADVPLGAYRAALTDFAEDDDLVLARVAQVCLHALREPERSASKLPPFDVVVDRLGLDSGDRLVPAEPPEPLRVLE